MHAGLQHGVLLHAGPDDLTTGLAGFIREGVRSRSAVMIALPRQPLAALREEMSVELEGITLFDMEESGRNPGAIISAWADFATSANGRRMRGVGQSVWEGRSNCEFDECHRYESLLNVAFPDGPEWRMLCPYDTSRLPANVISNALATHPLIATDTDWSSNACFDGGASAERSLEGNFASPPADAATLPFDGDQIRDAWLLARSVAERFGLGAQRVDDMTLAVSEIVTNSVHHGGGSGTLRVWATSDELTCEISDSGCVEDPLVGRMRPPSQSVSGRGLWVSNRLCDLVQLRSGPSGTIVRLMMRRRPSDRAADSSSGNGSGR